ncbi:pyrroloquinoline quinone biosynthesis protein PqqE [Saccharopolyspora griseoalba]|uniref:PqqA peptide cyclase n=1 Tax=Saccharopolyspora griseoalba TaxID=1431848 RepID=A0ABW2LPK9_9PSEU
MSSPFGLLAELTYACPLHCAYCSNPLDLAAHGDELSTAEWLDVLEQARALGVLQVHFSGGEPLLRRDLPELVRRAAELGLYGNLITSGLGFSRRRAEELIGAGLGHVQISVQSDTAEASDRLAGTRSFERKLAAAALVKELGATLTLNFVLHRHNIDRLTGMLRLAEGLGADRIELANTQYYGWAWRNRTALLPAREQLRAAEDTVRAARGRMSAELVYVLPDYYENYPKPCMGGWASRQLTVAPDGEALPCPAAQTLPLPRTGVREASLSWIWWESAMFRAFRGTGWMPEPCRSCARREVDHGGCRCQAFQLTGDPARTDPVCVLSPDHHLVAEAVATANADPPEELVPRPNPGRRSVHLDRDDAQQPVAERPVQRVEDEQGRSVPAAQVAGGQEVGGQRGQHHQRG